MANTVDYDGLVHVLRTAAARVKAGAAELGRLDSAVGDGDHGIAMTRAMEAIEKGIDGCPARSGKALLQGVAWSVMSIDAGATGPLMGSLLMGMVEPAGEVAEFDPPRLAAMFAAGLAKMRAVSKASVGDKTMLDALVPAVEALQAAASGGDSVAASLAKAAAAAQSGAEGTKTLLAKFGKARNLGERSLGHQDPGATSIALFFQGLAEGAAAEPTHTG
ncbi:MAG: dihydroxyacetone kinase subunit DhaL [Pirellulaceae bacterium]|nr:dihydroxyacetone kinase subunit DhaL [Pirellulaceae bacterium]